jgi:pyruvate/2-oxoglutarate dehydrogenase complex dihydrolipoamide dehydrogenase (E3) component
MYDLVVLGGGAGGLNVATAAAKVGAKVALIEKNRLGGECTYTACVPSKALIQSARVAHTIRQAGAFGIRVAPPEVDFPAVMARVRQVVSTFAASDSAEVLRARGIDVIFGSPAFEAYDSVIVDGQTRINGRRFVIATGSRPYIPSIPGLLEAGYLDNNSIWNLKALPATLLVIGAGPAGLEFAQAFRRLGSQVTVISDTKHILPREDPEIADRVEKLITAEGIALHTNSQITGVVVRDGKKVCKFRSQTDGSTYEAARDEILVATGRSANVEGLNLEKIGIRVDSRSGIEVDDHLQSHCRNVWAVGDVLGRFEFTHAAEREAAVVFQNAVLRLPKRMDYSALPWATFIDPEVATVGRLTGPEPGEEPHDTLTFRVELDDIDRARIDGAPAAFAKLVATPAGKILGVTIVAPEASSVIHEFVLAMEHGLSLMDLINTVHIYPTYAGLARKLANRFGSTKLEKGIVQNALRWIYGFAPRSEPAGPSTERGHLSTSTPKREPVTQPPSQGH